MNEIVSIGSLTLDMFFQDKSLTIAKKRFFLAIGGKYVVDYFSQGVGGGGGNIAVGLSRAEIKTALWSEIGQGGVSQLILSQLNEEGVDANYLEEKEEFTIVSAILLSPSGERTIINHRSRESELTFDDKHKKLIREAKALYLGNLPEVDLNLRATILEYAKAHNLVVYLNLGVRDCRRGLKALKDLCQSVDYLIINRYELADILKVQPNEILPMAINYQPQLFTKSSSTLVLTDGEFGSYAQTSQEIYHQRAYKVEKVVDSTGAGDAFTTGFIAARHYQMDIKNCLRAGARNSASVIQKVNAQVGLLEKDKLLLD